MKHFGKLACAGSMLALALAASPASAAPGSTALGKSQVAPGATSQIEQVHRRCWRRCWRHRHHWHCRRVCGRYWW